MAIEIDNSNEVTEFTLLEGTPEAFSFKWPTAKIPIGPFVPKVDAVFLQEMMPRLAQTRSPEIFLIHGIRLGWIFTAMEAERARNDLAKAKDEIADLRARIEKLEKLAGPTWYPTLGGAG